MGNLMSKESNLRKVCYSYLDDNTNEGIEYVITNGEVVSCTAVVTGKNKKALFEIPKSVTIFEPREGYLKNCSHSYISKYDNGIIFGNVVRIEETPDRIVAVFNKDDNMFQYGNKIYLTKLGFSLC